MKIYFSCSITGGRQDQHIYHAIVQTLLEGGHEVPTAHLSRSDVIEKEVVVEARDVYERDVQWVKDCDAFIAEVSTPSHGVGYEIALALALGRPVLCCYHQGRKVSKMILGNTHPTLKIYAYQSQTDLIPALKDFLYSLSPGD